MFFIYASLGFIALYNQYRHEFFNFQSSNMNLIVILSADNHLINAKINRKATQKIYGIIIFTLTN